jgi:hypothetical protein
MGTFYTKCRVENPVDRARYASVPRLPVHTGAEYSWILERALETIRTISYFSVPARWKAST